MKIHRIQLKDYRGIAEAEYEFPPVGVTIVEGPNETGKSCIAEALRHVLKYKDSTTRQDVADVRPEGRDVGPEVEVEIETGSYRFVLNKRWFRSKGTTLRVLEPSPQNWTGDEAHDRVQQILDETLDRPLWEALNVIQGGRIGPTTIPAASTLSKALDEAAGGARAGDREYDLYERVEAEYAKYYTLTERPKGDLKDGSNQIQQLETRYEEAKAGVEMAERDAAEAARLEREVAQKHVLEQELDGRRASLTEQVAAAQGVRDKAEGADAEHKRREDALDDLERRSRERERLARAVKDAQDNLSGIQAKRYEAKTRARELNQEFEEADAVAKKAEQQAKKARRTTEAAAADALILHTQFDLMLLKERRDEITKSEKEAEEAREVLETNAVDKKAVDAVDDAAKELRAAEERLAESSPSIRFRPAADVKITVGDATVRIAKGKTHDHAVVDGVTVKLPGFGRIDVRPGSTLEELQDRAARARAELEKRLKHSGARDVDHAHVLHDAWKAAKDAVKAHDNAVKKALRSARAEPFSDVEEMDGKIADLRQRIEKLRRTRPKGAPLPKDRDQARALEKGARKDADDKEGKAEKLRSQATAAQGRQSDARENLKEIEGGFREAHRTHKSEAARLAEARGDLSDKDLAEQVAKAKSTVGEAKKAWEEARRKLEEADLDGLTQRLHSAKKAAERARNDLDELRTTLTRTQERLRIAADDGVAESADAARNVLERARRDHTSLQRRAEAAKLLRDKMKQHRDAAQRRYAKPLADQIQSLARIVLGPDTRVVLDEELGIQDVTRNGTSLLMRKLSGGTTEQLGIIQRLACAMIVSKDGQGVPVIIDDALGYSDPDRIGAMGAVFDQAARDCQVIILTCVPDRYARIGNATVLRTQGPAPAPAPPPA